MILTAQNFIFHSHIYKLTHRTSKCQISLKPWIEKGRLADQFLSATTPVNLISEWSGMHQAQFERKCAL